MGIHVGEGDYGDKRMVTRGKRDWEEGRGVGIMQSYLKANVYMVIYTSI